MKLLKFFTFLMIFLFGVALFPILQNMAIDKDTSTWTFIGHEFIAQLMPIMPWLFLAIFTLVPVYFIVEGARHGSD